MTIASEISTLLLGDEVQSIQFTAESVRIDGRIYRRLADDLATGKISIEVGTAYVSSDADAEYSSSTNTLSLKSASLASNYAKQVVVHEMTHAATDLLKLTKSRGLHRTENEGLAYIAESIYVLNIAGARANKTDWRLSRVADRIAKKIYDAYPRHYIVSPAEMRELRNAIGQTGVYRDVRGQIKVTDGI